jgi:hypothetical protein
MEKIAEIREELKQIGVNWESHPVDTNVFNLPQGYFDNLAGQILNNIQASDTGTQLDLQLDRSGPFQVPVNYFENLSGHILRKTSEMRAITDGDMALFGHVPSGNPYHIPENYFSTLEQNIYQKLGLSANAAEEMEYISPLLASLKDKPTYEAPATYFNAFYFSEKIQTKTIECKTVEHPSAKSIKWARWAAAASIICIFSLGGIRFLNSNLAMNPNAEFEQSLSKIPDAKIQAWLSNNLDESDINNLKSSLGNVNAMNSANAADGVPTDQPSDDATDDLY